MRSSFLGIGLGVALLACAWLGCGGSEAGGPGSSGGGGGGSDGGTDGSATGEDGGGGGTDSGGGGGGGRRDARPDGNIDAPEVAITFGNCAAFTACGGDEKGTWKVSGGCLSESVLDDAKNACPGLTTSNEDIKAKGIVTADGTNITRQTQVKFSAKVTIPKSCADQAPANGNCNFVALGVQAQGFDSAACTKNAAGGCDCDVADTLLEATADTYTKNGNTIETSGGEEYDYCVAGSKLSFVQTKPETFPVVFELTK